MSDRGGGEQPPDLTEAVLGFRVWSVAIDGRLGAVVAGSFWTPGINEAVCDPAVAPSRRRHVAPQPGCNCGFNAYFALRKEIRRHHGSLALGAIAAWGAMDVYADGFRAQYAQVIALARPADPDDEGSPVKFHLQRLERAGAALLGREPTDVLVFEDSVPGIRGALAAGMRCIAVGTAPGDEVRAVAPAVVPGLSTGLLDAVLPRLRNRGPAGR